MSPDMAAFIDFPKCSCMIGRSLLTLPMFLDLVAFFISRIVSCFLQSYYIYMD